MRLLFTLCILSVSFCCFGQTANTSGVIINKKDSTKSPVGIRMRCGGSLQSGNEPLFVIDGDPYQNLKLSLLNPHTIDSIFVLKGATALALYGSAGENGVVIITTKKLKQRTFIIKDFADGSAIAGATVSFISANKKDTITMAANDSGIVSTNKLKLSSGYEMKVSSTGYHSFSLFISTTNNSLQRDIYLNRDTKSCEPVILSATQCRMISCTLYCRVSGMTIKYMASPKLDTQHQPLSLKIYPNPLQKGGTINLQFNINDENDKSIRLISLDGKQLLQQPLQTSKGNTVSFVSADSRWASGIYFIQLICEKGRVLASEKIIIR